MYDPPKCGWVWACLSFISANEKRWLKSVHTSNTVVDWYFRFANEKAEQRLESGENNPETVLLLSSDTVEENMTNESWWGLKTERWYVKYLFTTFCIIAIFDRISSALMPLTQLDCTVNMIDYLCVRLVFDVSNSSNSKSTVLSFEFMRGHGGRKILY